MRTVSTDAGRLDDAAALAVADSGGMLRAVATSAAQVRSAATAAAEAGVDRLGSGSRPRAVVVTGMGSSGIAGKVLAALAGPRCQIPAVVVSGFALPAWVGAADLVVALSRSGTTAEPLAVTEEAVRRGAEVVGIGTAGTPLHDLTERARGVFVPVSPAPPARAAFFAMATPLVVLGGALGLLDADAEVLEATAQRLSGLALSCQPTSESFLNPAKELALRLASALPMAWGTSPATAVAADRLVSAWALNAGAPALAGALPDAAHDQIGTFDGPWAGVPEDLFADPHHDEVGPTRLQLILLRDPDTDPRVGDQVDAARDVAERRGLRVTELRAEGASRYEQLASLIGLIDFASVYLGLLTGVDPCRTVGLGRLAGSRARRGLR